MGITKEEREVGVIEEEIPVIPEKTQVDKEINPYRTQLKEKENPFADKNLSYFLTDHNKRISQLGKTVKKTEESITYIDQFLEILSQTQQGNEEVDLSKMYNKNLTNYRTGSRSVSMFFNTVWGVSRRYLYQYGSQRLPHCCGVCEYGGFVFDTFTKVEEELVYNLMLDLIRLTANIERRQHSGAIGIINYFVGLPFMKVLNQRDDLSFTREFKNPKTGATLRMFIFNTKI